MARGWESKSVEEQQAEFSKSSGNNDKKGISPQDNRKAAESERLKLARANVQNQLKVAQNPRYVELLTRELAELDRQIEFLVR